MKKIISAFLICIIILTTLCSCQYIPVENFPQLDAPENTALTVHFIDVGQGDSILLESYGSYVLIDAGESEKSNIVCNYIRALGTDTIDYVIATHPHSDHVGGLSDVIYSFECKNFITAETDQKTKTWLDVLSAVDKTDSNYIDAKVSSTYTFGEAKFEILGPQSDSYDDYNNYSVIVKATCGDTSFLFTGDAETLSEREMLKSSVDLSADVLKVGHHGSTTSSSDEFLDAVNPTYAVISCGKNNDYGHPHKEILKALSKRDIVTYRTDELSTIVAFSDKNDITFSYVNSDVVIYNPHDKNSTENVFIGNKNSHKVHRSYCESVRDMNKKNQVVFHSMDEAMKEGYSPCNNCNP